MKSNKRIVIILLVCLFALLLTGCAKQDYMEAPLGEGFGFWDIFVYPMAGIMWCIGKTVGFGSYPITIIIATLVVRTLAWPIYAKTNDMQLKMKLVQPEMDKIQAKYAGKEDQESKQRMQMETMQLYKKYGIGVGGCLMPLVQMPIFLGFYYTIRKIPACMGVEGHWLNIFNNTKLFGVDMIMTKPASFADNKTQFIGVVILAVLVGITQIVSILLSNLRQKRAKENSVSEIPEYRRPKQTDQQKSSEMMMKVMMYMMAGMMVLFVWQSPAGLGLYWVVGNIYTTLQSYIGEKNSAKRLEKLRNKVNRGR